MGIKDYLKSFTYLLWGRIVFLLLFFSSTVFFNYESLLPPASLEIRILLLSSLFYLCSCLVFLSIFFLVIKRRKIKNGSLKLATLKWFALAQILLDIPFWTLLVTLTGGVDSFFIFLFHVSIILGAIYCDFRGIVFTLIGSLCFVIFMSLINAWGLIPSALQPFTVIVKREPLEFVYRVGVISVSLVLVSFLTSILIFRTSRISRALDDANKLFGNLNRLNETILSLVPSGIIVVDFRGLVRKYNNLAANILGQDSTPLYDKKITELMDVTNEELFGGNYSKKIIGGKHGAERTYECNISPIISVDGEKLGSIIHIIDITDALKIQKEISDMEKTSALINMATALAHEIRNPLGSINGCVQMVANSRGITDEDRKLLGIVSKEVNRINQLVSSLLNLAKPEEDLVITEFNLSDLIDETISLFKASEASKRIVFKWHVAENLIVKADRNKVYQVLINLIKNAIEAIEEGSDGEVIVHAMASGGGKVEVRVEDNGCGISEQEAEKIFNQQFTTKNWGSGIGLSVSRAIMLKHGETLGLRKKEEKGSIFYFTLQCATS